VHRDKGVRNAIPACVMHDAGDGEGRWGWYRRAENRDKCIENQEERNYDELQETYPGFL